MSDELSVPVVFITSEMSLAKISSHWVNITSRWDIRQLLGISFGSIFLLFSYETSWGPHS